MASKKASVTHIKSGKIIDNATAARESLKAAKNGIASKKLILQIRAIQQLEQHITSNPLGITTSVFESIKQFLLKPLESHNTNVRNAAASCLAQVLHTAICAEQPAHSSPISRPSSARGMNSANGSFSEDEEQDGKIQGISRAKSFDVHLKPSKTTPICLSFQSALQQLSSVYSKPHTTSYLRSGIVNTYRRLFFLLGPSFIRNHYDILAQHLFVEMLPSKTIDGEDSKSLHARRAVNYLLGSVVRTRLLDSNGRMEAMKFILDKFLTVSALDNTFSIGSLNMALTELFGLMCILWSAIGRIHGKILTVLQKTIVHPAKSIRLLGAIALRTLGLAVPSLINKISQFCLKTLDSTLVSENSGGVNGIKLEENTSGVALTLASIVAFANEQPLYVPANFHLQVESLAISVYKQSSRSDFSVSIVQTQTAWILMASLMMSGSDVVKSRYLSRQMNIWRATFSRNPEGSTPREWNPMEVMYIMHCRLYALGSLSVFIENNEKLLTSDLTKQISELLLKNTKLIQSLSALITKSSVQQLQILGVSFKDLVQLVQRNNLRCQLLLVRASPLIKIVSSEVISEAISILINPEKAQPVQSSKFVQSSLSNWEAILSVGDNFGFGLVSPHDLKDIPMKFLHPYDSNEYDTSFLSAMDQDEVDTMVSAI